MTITGPVTASPPLTARSVIDRSGVVNLDERLRQSGALDKATSALAVVGRALWDGALRELAAVAEDFLDVDIAAVLIVGWRKNQDLRVAAARSVATGQPESVPLAANTFHLARHPRVDVFLGEVKVSTLRFELVIDIEVVDLSATVRDGALVELTSGAAEVTVVFSVDEAVLAKESRTFEPRLGVGLGAGIPLAPVPAPR